MRATNKSHRLEIAVELDIDQHRAAALERLRNQVGAVVDAAAAFRLDAERAGEPNEIDPGVVELHPDIAFGLLGKPAHGMQALLEDSIGAVVENHEYRIDLVSRRGPKPLTGIHGAAVADESNHRALGKRKLHAHGGGQTPANAPSPQPKITLRIIASNELANAGCRRERLLDHDCVFWQHFRNG